MSDHESDVEHLFRAAHERYRSEVSVPEFPFDFTRVASLPQEAVPAGTNARSGLSRGFVGFMAVCSALVVGLSLFQSATVSAQLETMQSRLADMIRKRSDAILTDSRMLSLELERRRYLLDQFGGGASSRYESIGGPDSGQERLRVVCRRHANLDELGLQPQAFAGLILFGNHNVTGGFEPVDLSATSRLSFEFRYPDADSEGVFYLRLKNFDNYETLRIPIETDEPRGQWQAFELFPHDDERTSAMASGQISSAIKAMTIYTDDFNNWRGDPQIELRRFRILPR